MEVGAEQAADAIVSGAATGAGVAALHALCPPLAVVTGGALAVKGAISAAQHWLGTATGKTQAERRYHAKKIILSHIADEVN